MRNTVVASVVILLTAIALQAAVADARPRKWTDRSGRFSIRAELMEVKDDQVVLKRPDGKTISVPLMRLSRRDQDFVVGIERMAGWSVQAKGASAAIHDPQIRAKAFTVIAMASSVFFSKPQLMQAQLQINHQPNHNRPHRISAHRDLG